VIVEDEPADGGVDELALHHDGLGVRHVLIVIGGGEINHFASYQETNRVSSSNSWDSSARPTSSVKPNAAAFALGARAYLGQVVDAEHHVLRGHGQRQAVAGDRMLLAESINTEPRLCASVKAGCARPFGRPSKIGVEGSANQRWMRIALPSTSTVRTPGCRGGAAWSAVSRPDVRDHFFEDVPNDGVLLFDHFLAC